MAFDFDGGGDDDDEKKRKKKKELLIPKSKSQEPETAAIIIIHNNLLLFKMTKNTLAIHNKQAEEQKERKSESERDITLSAICRRCSSSELN